MSARQPTPRMPDAKAEEMFLQTLRIYTTAQLQAKIHALRNDVTSYEAELLRREHEEQRRAIQQRGRINLLILLNMDRLLDMTPEHREGCQRDDEGPLVEHIDCDQWCARCGLLTLKRELEYDTPAGIDVPESWHFVLMLQDKELPDPDKPPRK